jgi:hypothetical protein
MTEATPVKLLLWPARRAETSHSNSKRKVKAAQIDASLRMFHSTETWKLTTIRAFPIDKDASEHKSGEAR